MSEGARPLLAAALVAAVLVACGGSEIPSATDEADTDVAGVVIERSDDPAASDTAIELPAGPATVGITWTRTDGAWVGLGARTLTAGEAVAPLLLDVTADDRTTAPRPDGCEVVLQAPEDAGLRADGHLAVRVVVDGPEGTSRTMDLDPVRLEVELAPGAVHRAAVAGASPLSAELGSSSDEASVVRCEGRFEPT